MQSSRTAIFVLAFCCVCWGFSFPAMKYAARVFETHIGLQRDGDLPLALQLAAQATFNAWRFGAAAVLYALLTAKQQRGWTAAELRGGSCIGLFFSAGMFAQIVGLRYTLPSISGFLTSLVVVFAPFGQAFLFRRRVGSQTWIAVALATLGIVVLSAPGSQPSAVCAPAPVPYLGEALTALGAVFFTGHVLAVDYFGKTAASTARLTLAMFVSTAVLSGGVGFLFGAHAIYRSGILLSLAQDRMFVLAMLALIAFCSVLALHLMNSYQPQVSPATASIVYCLEPLFATIFSVVLRSEVLTLSTVLGGTIILLAIVDVARRGNSIETQTIASK